MSPRRTSAGLLLIALLAFLGVILVTIPGWLAGQVETVSRLGPAWLVYVYLGAVGAGAILLLGASGTICWRLFQRSRRKRRRHTEREKSPSQLSRQQQEDEINENLAAVADLEAELLTVEQIRGQLEPLGKKIEEKRERQKLELVAFGAISSGKSSLLNALAGREAFCTDVRGGTTVRRNEVPWPGIDQVVLVDTPGLGEVEGAEHGHVSAEAAKDADLVLLVVDGPLRQWEFELLRHLGEMEKRVLICLNKEDWYDARERESLLNQIRSQTDEFVRPEDVISVRSRTTTRPRVRVLPDGNQVGEEVDVPIDITQLADRLLAIVQRDGRELLLANLLLQSRGLVAQTRQRVEEALDRRARELVDRYTWGAGGAAALSPFPMLDLVAGCAISTKMVVDLGRVYRQEIDLNSAVTLLGQLGKNLIGILGVSAATPAVTAAVATLLKTVPGVGTLAGGMLQGLVQALITRWIGAVFIQYFKHELQSPEGGLTALARREWEKLTTIDELRGLVRAARKELRRGS
jgi:small GTP-binding protein